MNAQYFIDKFEAIPDELWITDNFYDGKTGACCVLGHCGVRRLNSLELTETEEANAICKLFKPWRLNPANVNDCCGHIVVDGSVVFGVTDCRTPKARILAALEYIKANSNE